MRLFKKFFAISIGVILFFFVAKVLIVAFIAAAILTLVFGGLRQLKYRSQESHWENYSDEYDERRHHPFRRKAPLFYEEYNSYDKLADVHYIKVQ